MSVVSEGEKEVPFPLIGNFCHMITTSQQANWETSKKKLLNSHTHTTSNETLMKEEKKLPYTIEYDYKP